MEMFEKIMLILSGAFVIVIIIPLVLVIAYFIGAIVISKLSESNNEEEKINKSTKFKYVFHVLFRSLISIIIGLIIMYSALKIINQFSYSSSDEDSEIIMKRD
jgi:uncharacterized membrane protein